ARTAGARRSSRSATAEPAGPTGEPAVASTPIHIRVGDLVGWAGAAEIRSSFAGTLEGVLVLPGERVVSGQPVAWLRADVEDVATVAPRRSTATTTSRGDRAEPD
ncbi:MAG: [acyl-carrier-protein] S-malonyltransferase, partial [Acidimicrobiaceae bacterium]|nr:[acyl-carrier-protein] S-malonyltransferase [Acidimicrobiaceae bacterium]